MNRDIYSLAALRHIEEQADAAGIDLMQRAAKACADWIQRHYAPTQHILVAAGSGNNGGDALWAADMLAKQGYPLTILLPKPAHSPLTVAALAACRQRGLPIIEHLSDLRQPAQVLIDGLFGIGLNRMLSADWQQLIIALNKLALPTLALDVPSGLDAWRGTVYGAAIRASATITFLGAKPGLQTADGADHSGEVMIDMLSLPAQMTPTAEGTLRPATAQALQRRQNSHKGSYGTVCVAGGASGMLGAALLSGRAALAAGAGKVYTATLEPLPVDVSAPELMLVDAGQTATCNADVLVIGPGLSRREVAADWLRALLAVRVAKVLDADALNLIAADPTLAAALQNNQPCIITPHPAEAARLLQTDTETVQADRVSAARELAARFGCVAVLKGNGSIIARPDGFYRINLSGGSALAVAGQGDVLSGVCGALLAQGMNAFDAASLAVRVHGIAGDDYTRQQGGPIGLSASATLPLLSQALNRLLYEDSGE